MNITWDLVDGAGEIIDLRASFTDLELDDAGALSRILGRLEGATLRITGDSAAFFWLLNAAGNARDGQAGNEAALDVGGKIELVPQELAQVQAKKSTAHLKAR